MSPFTLGLRWPVVRSYEEVKDLANSRRIKGSSVATQMGGGGVVAKVNRKDGGGVLIRY